MPIGINQGIHPQYRIQYESMEMSIIEGTLEKHFEMAKKLFLEYAESLNFNICFQNFEEELNNLSEEYTRPRGCLLLALQDNRAIGCVTLSKCSSLHCEMKRMYVKPAFRGKRIGRKLAETLIETAEQMDFLYIRLHTLAAMKEAFSLYYSLGFKKIAPYEENPIKDAMYMELKIIREG